MFIMTQSVCCVSLFLKYIIKNSSMSKNLKHVIGQPMRFCTISIFIKSLFESVSSIRYKLAFVPIEDSDQPLYQHSLIRAFDGHSLGNQGSNIFSGGKLRLQSDNVWMHRLIWIFCCLHMPTCTSYWAPAHLSKHAQLHSGSTLLILVQAFVIFYTLRM